MRSLAINKRNSWLINKSLHRHCWQIYMENKLTAAFGEISLLKGENLVITGLPVQDELLKDKSQFSDPWRSQHHAKKRIIYAPHHTIPVANNLIHFSCFLDVCDAMLELAEKYADQVQFAFKPHPFLKNKLVDYWGQEKTDAYYNRWATMNNTQLSEGEYANLFAHSDAMIHDCGSFTLEYTFTRNPALFLVKPTQEEAHRDELNLFGQMAYDLHDKGSSQEDIERFILNVIAEKDPRREERESFYHTYLVPPHCKSASQNIINAILGTEEYSN